jgi:hypothetical protein
MSTKTAIRSDAIATAPLLFPRLFSILDHYRYFSQLLIAFRIMASDKEARARNDDEYENCDQIRCHYSESNEELRKVAINANLFQFDVLTATAPLLFPRLFSILDHYRYFSQLVQTEKLTA